ncbi:MAG: hypothetical protein GEU98_10055 [Pseudonocardiaceae bacterium]|nr:hypothetical protein [Pseudonocardiaceae bacterium]
MPYRGRGDHCRCHGGRRAGMGMRAGLGPGSRAGRGASRGGRSVHGGPARRAGLAGGGTPACGPRRAGAHYPDGGGMTPVTEVVLHDAFRATLHALARPGIAHSLPPDARGAVRLVLDAIWETDAPPTVITGEPEPGQLLNLPVGSEQEPELGATVMLIVDGSTATTGVRLSGPGVDGELRTELPLSGRVLAERKQACSDAPCGIDLLLIGPGMTVRGLPRTTTVEELS